MGFDFSAMEFKPISETEMQTRIADRIHFYRSCAGLTQEKLAKKAGVSVCSIQRIEQNHDGSVPSVSTLLRLTNAMDRNLGELFF